MTMDRSKIKNYFLDRLQDIVISDIRYIIPSFLRWFYHTKIRKDITVIPLKDDFGKKAFLYQHGKIGNEKGKDIATLILHGLYGHPAVMLHLAEMAQEVDIGPVFSLLIDYDKDKPETHRHLIRKAINTIQSLTRDQLKGIILTGHSMGGVEAAYSAFVEKNKHVLAVISIAGRLKVVEEECVGCSEALKASLHKIEEGIHSLPDFPLFQIVGEKDWSASLKSTLIRHDENCSYIIMNAKHLNLLFFKEMKVKFPEFLKAIKKGF